MSNISELVVNTVCNADFNIRNDSIPYTFRINEYVTVGQLVDWWEGREKVRENRRLERKPRGVSPSVIIFDEYNVTEQYPEIKGEMNQITSVHEAVKRHVGGIVWRKEDE